MIIENIPNSHKNKSIFKINLDKHLKHHDEQGNSFTSSLQEEEKQKYFSKVNLENFIKLEYITELAGQDCFG